MPAGTPPGLPTHSPELRYGSAAAAPSEYDQFGWKYEASSVWSSSEETGSGASSDDAGPPAIDGQGWIGCYDEWMAGPVAVEGTGFGEDGLPTSPWSVDGSTISSSTPSSTSESTVGDDPARHCVSPGSTAIEGTDTAVRGHHFPASHSWSGFPGDGGFATHHHAIDHVRLGEPPAGWLGGPLPPAPPTPEFDFSVHSGDIWSSQGRSYGGGAHAPPPQGIADSSSLRRPLIPVPLRATRVPAPTAHAPSGVPMARSTVPGDRQNQLAAPLPHVNSWSTAAAAAPAEGGGASSAVAAAAAAAAESEAMCPFCSQQHVDEAGEGGGKTRLRRALKRQRKVHKIGRWWRQFGYNGPRYCQRCSEVVRDHLMRQKANSANCSRNAPCDDCIKVVRHFNVDPEELWQRFDEQAARNSRKRAAKSSSAAVAAAAAGGAAPQRSAKKKRVSAPLVGGLGVLAAIAVVAVLRFWPLWGHSGGAHDADDQESNPAAPLPHLLRATCSDWRRVHAYAQPSPRAGAAMWQDRATGELLLFGGWGQIPNTSRGVEGELDDLWRLQTAGRGSLDDGGGGGAGRGALRWLRVEPNSDGDARVDGQALSWPPPRAHAMPYTDATGKHYLLGGTAAGIAQADLWILKSGSSRWVQQHPKDWTPTNDWPAHTLEELVLSSTLYTVLHSWPMQRSRGTITADVNRPDEFLLFGGAVGFGDPASRALPLSDLWQVGRDGRSNTVSQFTYVGPPQKPGYVAMPDLVGQPKYDAHDRVIGKFSWPGSRAGHGAWMDAVGNLIIFGGIGQITPTVSGSCGYRPDVWMWNGATGTRGSTIGLDSGTHLWPDAVWRRMQEVIHSKSMSLQPIQWDNVSSQMWQLPGSASVQHQRHRDQQACKSAWDADGGRRGLRPQPHTVKGAAVSAPPRAPPPSPSSAVPLPVGYAAATPSSLWLMSDRAPPPFVTGWGGPRLVVNRIRRKTDNQQHSDDEWDVEANPIVSCRDPNGTRTPAPRRADFAVVASSSHVVGSSQHRAEWMPTNGFVMFGGVDSSAHGNMSLSNELWIFEEQ
jgi:hypothetical protein